MKEYTAMPAAELYGNAGSLGPGEREQRYRPYMEKICLSHPDVGGTNESAGGCNGSAQ